MLCRREQWSKDETNRSFTSQYNCIVGFIVGVRTYFLFTEAGLFWLSVNIDLGIQILDGVPVQVVCRHAGDRLPEHSHGLHLQLQLVGARVQQVPRETAAAAARKYTCTLQSTCALFERLACF